MGILDQADGAISTG